MDTIALISYTENVQLQSEGKYYAGINPQGNTICIMYTITLGDHKSTFM